MSGRRPCAPWTACTSTAPTTLASRPSTKRESASTARRWSSRRPRVRPFSSAPQSESCAAAASKRRWPHRDSPCTRPGTGRGAPPALEGHGVWMCPTKESAAAAPRARPSASFASALRKLPLKKLNEARRPEWSPACEPRCLALAQAPLPTTHIPRQGCPGCF